MARIYVGMSGGVDSSVAASLLVEQGHDVTGVYMKNWSQDLPGMKCPWAEDLADAKRVAVQLGIDFLVFDFEREYRDKVVQYMIDEYQAGRTPNPDIMCNQEVKFRLFLDAAMEHGAEMIATGHYARTNSKGQLLRAHDDNKDQTYFLYRVTNDALKKTLFPLGDYTKQQVREMAAERDLFTARKKESMGVCFVGQVGMRDFLSQYVDSKPGDIIDSSTGRSVGRHDGAIFYTIGQRHGLDVGGGLAYYVTGKDMARNEVYVSQNLNDEAIWRRTATLSDVHWIDGKPQSHIFHARIRHRGELVSAQLVGDSTIEFTEAQRALTPGQSVVLYDDQLCLGGGIVS